jgi:Caspase domain
MKKVLWLLILLISFFLSEFPADADRGISVLQDLSHKSGKLGAYRALIIGINDYKDPKIPDLHTAVSDAKDMADLLIKHYGFQVNLLLNQDATKEAIYRALRNLASSTKSDDSVLIYYAGHGDLDRTYHDGWWIPVDAEGGNPITYLDNIQVQKSMRNMNARHVLLISDSCYSGTLFGQSRGIPQTIDSKYYVNLYNEKSRWGMTSGNKTPVSDVGSGGHSVFAYQLLKELGKNEKPYISIQELCTRIAPIVSNNSEQTPLCRPIRDTGDQGGEFVFVSSSDAKNISSSPEITAERRSFEQERMELERIKLEMERKNIEFERKKLEKKRLEQEKAQSGWLASIPETTVNSIEKKYRLAVFPITEIGFIASDLRNQRKFVDFIIKYTSSMPNVTLTHSYYPYNVDYTTHKITPIKELIDKDTEKKIWYGNSWLAKSKPDLKMLKELSNKMNSGLVLIFKIAIDSNSVVDIFKYTGYLVDIENNRSFKEYYSTEQSSSATDFGILEKMTKKLLKSYQKKSNS